MRFRPAVLGFVASLPMLLLSSVAGAADVGPGGRAVAYLLTLQGPDGSIDPGATTSMTTQSETAFTVIGAVALGRDPATLRTPAGATAMGYLAAHSASVGAESPDAAAGPTAEVILAAVAAGADPRHLGRPGVDLVRRLEVQDKKDHIYGFGDTRAQALGLLAEVASGTPVDGLAAARLRSMQDADGSWNEGVAAAASGDTDSTAIAVMALRAAGGGVPRPAEVLAFLHLAQNADGGFPRRRTAPDGDTNSNPVSDGAVVQALVALGRDPRAAEWTKPGGGTPIGNLLTFQDGSGGFHYAAGSPPPAPQGSTTAPLPAALALRPLPVLPPQRPVSRPPQPRTGAGSGVASRMHPGAHPAGAAAAATVPGVLPAASVPMVARAAPPATPTATATPVPVAVTIPVASPAPVVGGVEGLSSGPAAVTRQPGVGPPAWPGLALAAAGALAGLLLVGLRFRGRRTTT